MATLFDFLAKGGPVMIPLGVLSVATLACAFERGLFWLNLLAKEDKVTRRVLAAAELSLEEALNIAMQARHLPIGRFLLAPLQLQVPTPETVRLSLESAADKELIEMQKGDKLLETTVAMSPLLGLLGTVTGLIVTFANLNIGGGGKVDTSGAAAGIAESLITTAAGMVLAIVALGLFRLSLSLRSQQMNYFSDVGSRLELIYLQVWCQPSRTDEVQGLNRDLLQQLVDALQRLSPTSHSSSQ